MKWMMPNVFRQTWFVYLVGASVSLLLSAWIGYRENVINPDAICYIKSAEAVGTAGIQAAANVCGQSKWIFFSILIYAVSAVTHLSSILSAYFLDSIFSAISVLTFIYIVRLLNGSLSTLWLAVGVILLAHDFDSVREYIVRDHGFWAFYLISIANLLIFFRVLQWRYALLWFIAIVIATLFRIEGAVFLLLLPFSAFFLKQTVFIRFKAFFQLTLFTLLAVGALVAFFAIFSQHSISQVSRLGELHYKLIHVGGMITANFQAASIGLAQHVLNPVATKDANFVLFILLAVWYAVSVISSLSCVYAILVIYALWKKILLLDIPARLVIYGCMLINVAITIIFLAENMFMSKRYLIALTLLFLLWVPFALDKLIQKRSEMPKWLLPLVALSIIVTSLGGIFDFGYSKAYMREAGKWLAENTPEKAAIFSNDEQVLYYSAHYGQTIFDQPHSLTALLQGKWENYDYLVFRESKSESEINVIIQMKLSRIQTFANKRGDRVIIYKVLH